jgi:DNA-binding GntR family transcriptional regulator
VRFKQLLDEFARAGTTTDVVYAVLRHSIIHGELAPGERLRGDALAKQMQVSRTPVRDALLKLEVEGLATMSARSGLVVAELSEKNLIEVYQLREVLEGLAARLAAENATPAEIASMRESLDDLETSDRRGENTAMWVGAAEFNQLIYRASHNDRLVPLLMALQDRALQFRRAAPPVSGHSPEVLAEYRDLLRAIEARDGALSEKIARDHSRKTLDLVKSHRRKSMRAAQQSEDALQIRRPTK